MFSFRVLRLKLKSWNLSLGKRRRVIQAIDHNSRMTEEHWDLFEWKAILCTTPLYNPSAFSSLFPNFQICSYFKLVNEVNAYHLSQYFVCVYTYTIYWEDHETGLCKARLAIHWKLDLSESAAALAWEYFSKTVEIYKMQTEINSWKRPLCVGAAHVTVTAAAQQLVL